MLKECRPLVTTLVRHTCDLDLINQNRQSKLYKICYSGSFSSVCRFHSTALISFMPPALFFAPRENGYTHPICWHVTNMIYPNWVSVSLVLIKRNLQSQFDRLVVGNDSAWHWLCGLDSPTCCGISLQTSVFSIDHTTAFLDLELLSSPCVRHMQGFGVVLQWYFKGLHCVCWHPWLQDSWTSCGAKGQLKTCWKDGRLISLAVQHTGV